MTLVPERIKEIFPQSFHDRVFLVGGGVRDLLAGAEGKDIDLVAALSADQLASLGFRLVEAKSASPIWFRYHRRFGKIEVTLIDDCADLPVDLAGRDFTINAMAMTLAGRVIDPLGGRNDMAEKRLRACGPDAFRNDPVRIFRGFRFEAEGWRLAPESEQLLREEEWSGRMATIPMERFSSEMLKALEKNEPIRFFQDMVKFGVGSAFLPELFLMAQVPAGPVEHHPEGDLLTHSLQVLERVTAMTGSPVARFCAMFHDLGKLATDSMLFPRHHGHEEAGSALSSAFCARLRLPASYRRALTWTCKLHGSANRWGDLRDSTRIEMAARALQAGIVEILPAVSAADRPGAEMTGWDEVVRVAGMGCEELGISGTRLEALQPSERSSLIMQRRVEFLRRKRHMGRPGSE